MWLTRIVHTVTLIVSNVRDQDQINAKNVLTIDTPCLVDLIHAVYHHNAHKEPSLILRISFVLNVLMDVQHVTAS